MAKFSFCESVTGIGPWHIRKLSKEGPRYGGGIDTKTLCGGVAPSRVKTDRGTVGGGGWDLEVEITDHHLGHCCQKCAEAYRKHKKAHPG